MRLLISGAGGLLGRALVKIATEQGHSFSALDRANFVMSLSNYDAIDACFHGIDHFIHAAANTDVESCEENPAACYRDNLLLTDLLAAGAQRCGVPMTFISSTGVYGNHQTTPWAEYDDAHPTTHHHRSKLLGEEKVMATNISNLVVRTGWLFGGEPQATKNFVAKRILEAYTSESGFMKSNDQQRGCPTFVNDLAVRIFDLIAQRASGVFNVVNSGSASRFQYVQEIITQIGLAIEVRPVMAGDFNRLAPVSNNEVALNWRADSFGMTPMRSWEEALADYLTTFDMKALIR